MTCQLRMAHVVVIVEVAALVFAVPALAQDCPDLVHHWPGPISALAVSGDYAYIAGYRGLFTVDVSDSGEPRVIGELGLPDVANSIEVSQDHAYVASMDDDGAGGLRVIDVTTPSEPAEEGFLGFPDHASDVAVSGDYAYVAWGGLVGPGGLSVLDVSTPSAPTEVGLIETPGAAIGVAVFGSIAYVADWTGLRVIDVSTATAPVQIGSMDIPGQATDVAVSDGYAYLVDGDGALLVVDVSTPAHPVEVGSIRFPGRISYVAVAGGYAFVAADHAGLRVVDMRDPSTPTEVGSSYTPGYAAGLAVADGLAYLATNERGASVIDVSRPSAPVEVGSVGTMGLAYDVAGGDGFAYVAAAGGLQVLNASDLSSPVESGHFVNTTGGLIGIIVEQSDVEVAGDHVYMTRTYCGEFTCFSNLGVFDVRTPASPALVASVGNWNGWVKLAVSSGYVYVANDATSSTETGLRVIDVRTPSAPVEVGFVHTPGAGNDVAVSGSWAYVADGVAGLRVVDVSVPSAPREVGSIDTPGDAEGVAVSGTHAFVADGESGLVVIDISVPTAPAEVGVIDTPGYAHAVALSGDFAYVADVGAGVLAIDVSAPSDPVLAGTVELADSAVGVATSDGSVLVAAHEAGLYVCSECGPLSTPSVSFIPAAAFATGAEGAFFQTDVEINNTGLDETQIYFEWLPRGEDNSAPLRSATFALGPGESRRFENALATLFELGPDSLGALELVASTESVIGMSRTYNIPAGGAAGTFGQGLPAIRATEMFAGTEPQRIVFLSENPEFRANVGCVNGSHRPVRINIRAFNDGGALLSTRTMDLGPWSNNQINRVFGGWTPVNGYVDVWSDSDAALYYCYGSLLDNTTSDPTTVLPQVPLASRTFIPAAALAAGLEGSFFETDLDLNNAGRRDISYELLWLPRGADNSDPLRSRSFSLAPGAGVRYANVLNSVFGLEPDQVGALAIEASGTELLAMSRTYNLPPVITAGTFGQGLPAVTETVMIGSGQRKRIIFMSENDDVRSNVGCQNGSQEAVRVFIELFDSDGNSLETKMMDLKPLSNSQITRVFRDHAPISAGYVDVWTNAPGASIYCYGSVLDNFTSDPITVLPQ